MNKDFAVLMEDLVPASVPPQASNLPRITPEQLEQIKAIARERAIQATLEQQGQTQLASINASKQPTYSPTAPNVVYVRRNFTVAELILIVLLSCGLVAGAQYAFNFATNFLPRLEIKVK
jgi:hypothetical protein